MVSFCSPGTDSLVGEIHMALVKQHYTRKDKEKYIVANGTPQNIKAIGVET